MKTILITGANRGIGLEMVKQYSQDNWQVLACCRSPLHAEALNALQMQTNNQVKIFQLDVTDESSIQILSNDLKSQAIDVLVNNAGVWGPHQMGFGNVKVKEWLNVLETNTISPLLVAQALIEQLAIGELKVIANMSSNMGSISSNTTGSEYIYRSSKAALNAVTKSMALDLQPRGISVVALHPGWVKTDMGGPNAPLSVDESVSGLRKVIRSITQKDSGRCIGYDGNEVAW